jgi:hypothetical protein
MRGIIGIPILVFMTAACGAGPNPEHGAEPAGEVGTMPAALEPGSIAWKIEAYSTAAPPELAAAATVLDHGPDGSMVELRAGSNGWTCMPSAPPGDYRTPTEAAPMCSDAMFMQWLDALVGGREPDVSGIGLSYMLHGDVGSSNIDPGATGPTADNEWVVAGPHVMIIGARPGDLDAIPASSAGGGPWVMWKGTPWEHVMMPVPGHR